MNASATSTGSSSATALATALTPAVWGTTYIVATELLPAGRPMLAALVRALPVGVAFVLWTRILPTGAWWWKAAVLGVLNIGAFFALLFVAAFRLPGGVAATAGAVQPLVAATIAAVVIGEAFTRRTALAGAAGIGGVAMLVLAPDAALDPIGIVAAFAGTACMATGVVLTKHWGRPVDLITFTGWQLAAGGLLLAPVVAATEGIPSTLTATNAAGFTWLAVVGTGLAYANWFRGIQALPVAVVSFLGLLSPLVATIAGWAVLDQSLTVIQLAGAALVVAAVVLPQLPARRVPDEPRRRVEVGGSRVGGGGRIVDPVDLITPRRRGTATMPPTRLLVVAATDAVAASDAGRADILAFAGERRGGDTIAAPMRRAPVDEPESTPCADASNAAWCSATSMAQWGSCPDSQTARRSRRGPGEPPRRSRQSVGRTIASRRFTKSASITSRVTSRR